MFFISLLILPVFGLLRNDFSGKSVLGDCFLLVYKIAVKRSNSSGVLIRLAGLNNQIIFQIIHQSG